MTEELTYLKEDLKSLIIIINWKDLSIITNLLQNPKIWMSWNVERITTGDAQVTIKKYHDQYNQIVIEAIKKITRKYKNHLDAIAMYQNYELVENDYGDIRECA